MDRTFSNVIYLNKKNNFFALFFIMLSLLLPNIGLITSLFVLYGKELVTNRSLLLPTGLYTILTLIMVALSYFIMENNSSKSIRVLDEGFVYNSLFKKFAGPWTSIYQVKVNPFPGGTTTVMVYSEKGRFYFSGMFVDINEELPQIKPGLIKPKFYYPSGGSFYGELHNNELYLVLKEKIPDKFS